MPTYKWVIPAAAFGIAGTCMILGGYVTSAMIGDVNRVVPESERISYVGGTPGKWARIFREYRRHYPRGALARIAIALDIGAGLCLAFLAYWLLF